jgi:hypothetical protein
MSVHAGSHGNNGFRKTFNVSFTVTINAGTHNYKSLSTVTKRLITATFKSGMYQ